MSLLNDETTSSTPSADGEQPVWNGVDADFYLPDEPSRGWFGARRRGTESGRVSDSQN